MRKLIVIFVLILSLCGCSNAAAATPQEVAAAFRKDFSAKATAVFGDNETGMSISKNGMSISILLDSPAELAGMGIELFDEHAKVTYQGMEQEIDTDSLPGGTPFLLLEELFNELANADEFALSTEDGNLVAKNDDFTAVLSSEDLSLISAAFQRYATEFSFSDWAFGEAG
ncbi:MAG: hypothetical protein IJ306_06485 [Oscillospiraceae bacterium]|nr:hypothetical protein [Oscillospiraceae bacterium]